MLRSRLFSISGTAEESTFMKLVMPIIFFMMGWNNADFAPDGS
jgi:hypothetical protein